MPDWSLIKQALENNRYKWRTIRGVAKEVNCTPQEVIDGLNSHSDEVIKSSVPADSGEDLFTTRQNYRRKQSPFFKIASSITSSVGGSGA